MMRISYAAEAASIGWIAVAATDSDSICNVCLGDTREAVEDELQSRHPSNLLVKSASGPVGHALRQIVAHIENPSSDLDINHTMIGTSNQKDVWRAIRRIPMGQTTTYAQLASDLGVAGSSRAIAQACGANPLAILVPCHRVVKSDGSLAGYRWGEERKQKLLEREKATRARVSVDRPQTSAFARGQSDIHVVPMSVIRRPVPSELDEDKVQTFVQEMKNGDVFTPIEVVKVRSRLKHDPTGPMHNFYFSLGGCHRYEATRRLGLPTIRARIIETPASQIRIYLGAGSPF